MPKPGDSTTRGDRLLFEIIVTVGVTLLGLGVIALICWYRVPSIVHDQAFDARYTVFDIFFYAGQPAKTWAYQLGCLASPFLLIFSLLASRRWAEKLPDVVIDRVNLTGLVLYLLLIVSCALPLIYCPDPPFWIIPPSRIMLPLQYSQPFCSPLRLLILLTATAFALYLLRQRDSRRNSRGVFSTLLAIWVLMIPSRFYLPCEISDDMRFQYHFNAVLDALSQAVNGHHLLVNFPHIYGGYIEMLAPLIRLFPRDPGVLIIALAIPNIIAVLCQLLLVVLLIRPPAIRFLCGLAMLGVIYLFSSVDINYSYITARFVFPSIGLLAAVLYFRNPTAVRYAITTTIAALASIWNLDTGIVFWLSWLVTLMATELAQKNFAGTARHLLMQVASLVAAWVMFLIYLRLASGQWPDSGLIFYFQTLVIDSGYFCLRLLFPDTWVFILTLYVIGLALAVASLARRKSNWMTSVILMVSLYGIGSFSYFIGRSAPSNLVFVSCPAVLLAGILWAKCEVLLRRGKLPAYTRFFLLPTKIAFFWWAFLMLAALPDLISNDIHSARNWNNNAETPFRENVTFIKHQVRSDEAGVFFVSNHSGFYYYLSDTVRPLKIPGMIELLYASDMETLIHALQTRQIPKLFVEQNFYDITMYRPEFYARIRTALAQNYRVAEISPTGRLILYVPR